MRKYHRWLAPVFGLFLLFMSITGTLLALDDMTSPTALERRGSKPVAPSAPAAALPLEESAALLQKALRQAGNENLALRSITLSAQGPQLRIELQPQGHGASILFDARSGVRLPLAPPGPDGMPAWRGSAHGWLEYLHRGAFASWPGVMLVLLSGMALLVFSITGLTVYLDMARRRWKSGRKEWFW
ncbi:PepSY-associated TM helix domain-containing protein [Pseudoxanthomonas sp.]|uniref:PepSY-associated TM helix domain-containing protein n=1 Tax=Pseudoxanthomonas sp. TaxID=1871049 RepID=UPI002632E9FE|nr:PepSY-associated TM helix domain-containing protein [Pseudoxanthomonas sp.]WDS35028.1 MAG: PepSY-associated TM helix domain-containing protein [Pseudoxanthomonas sp.]